MKKRFKEDSGWIQEKKQRKKFKVEENGLYMKSLNHYPLKHQQPTLLFIRRKDRQYREVNEIHFQEE